MFKKRLGIFKKGLGLVLGFLVFFSGLVWAAEIKFSGDGRIRAVSKQEYDFNDKIDDDSAYISYRVRIKPEIMVTDGVTVRSRLRITGDGEHTWGTDKDAYVAWDYAYVHITAFEPFVIDVGRQLANWGNKFATWSKSVDALQVAYKLSNGKLIFIYDKEREDFESMGEADLTSYHLAYIYTGSPFTVGARVVYTKDGVVDDSGMIWGVFFRSEYSGIKLLGEWAMKSGDLWEDSAGKSPHGGFLGLEYSMNEIAICGQLAYASNGYEATKYFQPTLLIGTDQITALGDFGAADDETSWLAGLGARYKYTDKLSFGARVGYLSEAGDANLLELDFMAMYKVAKNVNFHLDFVTAFPNDYTCEDDTLYGAAARLEFKF